MTLDTHRCILFSLWSVTIAILGGGHSCVAAGEKPAKVVRIDHVKKVIEGWTVHVDHRLLDDSEHSDLGQLALRVLGNQLFEIALIMPKDKLAALRRVPIFLDLDHPLRNLQYHPSRGWLTSHGYDPLMTKAVHIPQAKRLVELIRNYRQPRVILHELAHAYHDRVLGFNEKRIRAAFDKAVASGLYKKVRHISGREVRHYALTNHHEYFAELTEAYFGTNDFFPFVYGELRHYDPTGFAVLEAVWGKRK